MNDLYRQLQGGMPNNNMIQQFLQFKNSFKGNPQEMVQQMLNSGRMSQDQFNRYAQQANQIMNQMKNLS